jgi:hypothetical protein
MNLSGEGISGGKPFLLRICLIISNVTFLIKKIIFEENGGYFAFLVALRLIAVKPTVRITVMAK